MERGGSWERKSIQLGSDLTGIDGNVVLSWGGSLCIMGVKIDGCFFSFSFISSISFFFSSFSLFMRFLLLLLGRAFSFPSLLSFFASFHCWFLSV